GAEAGNAVAVNGILAIIGKKGTDITPLFDAENSEESVDTPEPSQPTNTQTTANVPVTTTTTSESTDSDGRIKASPLAKSMAKEKGIDLALVNGTGDGGRIIKRDIENYQPKANTSASNSIVSGQESYTDIPLTQMRSVIARRLGESKFSAPHFYLNISVKMDNAAAARTELNKIAPVKISFNDFIIKACAQAL